MQVHDAARSNDSIEGDEVIQRNSEKFAAEEATSRFVESLVRSEVVMSERQTIATAQSQSQSQTIATALSQSQSQSQQRTTTVAADQLTL